MRKILLIAATLALGTSTAYGNSYTKFQETITLPANSAVKINVVLSEDMAHRADNLPEFFEDRGRASRQNDGFRGNGHYGQKELDDLMGRLSERLTKDLSSNGVRVSDTAPYTLLVTIDDARPNRPTTRQLSKSVNLSFSSRALGGATVEGQLVDASGNTLGAAEYGWYERNLGDSIGLRTWEDAERALNLFSLRLAKSISD